MFAMAQGTYSRVDVSEGVHCGELIKETLRAIDMPIGNAALIQELDPATWSRALSGLAPLDLWKMRRLGWSFWSVFAPKFIAASFTVWCQERLNDWKERV